MIIIFVILFPFLLWLASPGAITPTLWPRERRGQGRAPVIGIVVSSSRVALTWGMPAALIYQLCAFRP
jgi:hypothetical protein